MMVTAAVQTSGRARCSFFSHPFGRSNRRPIHPAARRRRSSKRHVITVATTRKRDPPIRRGNRAKDYSPFLEMRRRERWPRRSRRRCRRSAADDPTISATAIPKPAFEAPVPPKPGATCQRLGRSLSESRPEIELSRYCCEMSFFVHEVMSLDGSPASRTDRCDRGGKNAGVMQARSHRLAQRQSGAFATFLCARMSVSAGNAMFAMPSASAQRAFSKFNGYVRGHRDARNLVQLRPTTCSR